MQKILLSSLIFLSTIYSIYALESDKIELAITPIRSDIKVSTGESTSASVTLYNNSNEGHSFYMTAENCTTNSNNGTPNCKPYKGNGINPSSLASWITFDNPGNFTIPARWKKTISYTINTPANAVPGWHYGAIFFNTINPTGNANISMNRRIGSLILITVPWEIVVSPIFGDIIIVWWGWYAPIDNILDLFSPTESGSIWEKTKKLLMTFSDPAIQQDLINFINPFWSTPAINKDETFNVDISLPVENEWTIHVNPEWNITLHEKDWTQLLNIGKELIINENWAIIGEKIVDYITINEEWWNVLPNTNRIFTMNWNWFAHEYITSSGNIWINYESPGVYYSRLSKENEWYVYPWQKLALVHSSKTLTAKVNLSYINPITNERVFKNSEVPIEIQYNEVKKTWNTWLLCILFTISFIIWWHRRKLRKNHHNGRFDSFMNDEIRALERAQTMIYGKTRQTIKQSKKKLEALTEFIPTQKKKTENKSKTPLAEKTPVKRAPRKVVPIVEEVVAKKAPVKRAPVKKIIEEVPARKTTASRVTWSIEPRKTAPVKTPTIEKAPVKRAPRKVVPIVEEVVVKKAPVKKNKEPKSIDKSHTKKHKHK